LSLILILDSEKLCEHGVRCRWVLRWCTNMYD